MFIRIGNQWINVTQVQKFYLTERYPDELAQTLQPSIAVVFVDHTDYLFGDERKALLEWLERNDHDLRVLDVQ